MTALTSTTMTSSRRGRDGKPKKKKKKRANAAKIAKAIAANSKKEGVKRRKATDRERALVRLILAGTPRRDAYYKCGYTGTQWNNLLRKIMIRPRVRRYMARLRGKLDTKAVLTAAEIVAEQAALLRLNFADLFHADGSPKEPHEWGEAGRLVKKIKRDPETGRITEIETISKDQNLDRLNKIYGLYEKDNKVVVELKASGAGSLTAEDIKQMPTDELKRLAESKSRVTVIEGDVVDAEVETGGER